MNEAKDISLILGMGMFLLIFISQGILLYAAYFKLNHIEKHFSSYDWRRARSNVRNGPIDRMRRLREIGELMGTPNHLCMFDHESFREAELLPTQLKRWVVIPRTLILIAFGIILFLWVGDGYLNLIWTISNPMGEMALAFTAAWVASLIVFLMAMSLRAGLSFFKLEEFESYLESSYFIGRNRRVLGDGVLGRLRRLTHISLMLAPDSDFVFGNDAQVIKAIKTFPGHLRRWIEISQRFTACSFFGLVALWGLGKVTGLLG